MFPASYFAAAYWPGSFWLHFVVVVAATSRKASGWLIPRLPRHRFRTR
jgi:hypothetical protein